MARRVHTKAEKLSAEAHRLMLAGFREGKTYAAIARDLAEIGEPVPERTIGREGARWRAEQSRRGRAKEQAMAMLEAMRDGNWESSEMLRAIATDWLLANPDVYAGIDPVKLQSQNLYAEELRLKREKLAIQARQVAVDEKRLALLEDRERRMTAALTADKGEQLTAEERLKRAMEAWGLK